MLFFTNKQIKEVSTALRNERDNVEMFKRLQVLLSRMKGTSERDAAVQSGFSVAKVSGICRNYLSNGIDGLRSKRENCGGRNRKLSKEAEASALARLAEKAKTGQFIRVAELQAEFEKDTGVSYHPIAFYDVLERNNWRKVVPRGRHPKAADEATCEASKKLTL